MHTYPKVVSELKGEDSDAFVVERARDRAGDVAGDDGDEAGRQQAGALVPQLPREKKGGDGGQAAKHGSQEHADVADVHGDVQQVQHVVNEARRDHQAWIHLDKDETETINLLLDFSWPGCKGGAGGAEFRSANARRRAHRAPDYPAQRVPGSLVKPVEELVEAIGGEVVS